MRRKSPLALLTAVALAGGMSACGSDEDLSTKIPRTSPDLTVPTGTTPASTATRTSTTATTTTTTQQTAPPAAAAAPPATPPPAAATGSPTTGGATPATGQSTTGGAASNGEFDNFCAQNPGAC